jgi:DnaJ-class molecular chaperone
MQHEVKQEYNQNWKELLSLTNEVHSMAQAETCDGCSGNGYVRCPICEGSGVARKKTSARKESYLPEKFECQTCQGTGRILCKICEGVGKILPEKAGSSKT